MGSIKNLRFAGKKERSKQSIAVDATLIGTKPYDISKDPRVEGVTACAFQVASFNISALQA
jgi:hypothetical protein